jgi:uncharacterized membrane protein (DUF4010 family)
MEQSILIELALSLGLGLLVGLQREWTPEKVAGIRTFALITVLGTVLGQTSSAFGPWLIPAGFLAVGGMLIEGHILKVRAGETSAGLTTEVAALVMYGVGVVITTQMFLFAVVTTGLVTVLLHWKKPMHSVIEQIGEKDLRSIVQFVLISLVILPLLPNRSLDPYEVINPFEIWLMVVLIVGISMSGYIAHRLLGSKAGTIVAGVLGGIVSSTATTASTAERSKHSSSSANLGVVIILLATMVQFLRVGGEIYIVARDQFMQVVQPVVILCVTTLILSLLYLVAGRRDAKSSVTEDNPANLKTAVIFGLLYGIVLLGVAVAKDYFGEAGLYVVALLSGTTDMDAITLSTSRHISDGKIAVDTGARMIVVGGMGNLVFKGLMVASLSNKALLKRVVISFAVLMAVSALALVYLPMNFGG